MQHIKTFFRRLGIKLLIWLGAKLFKSVSLYASREHGFFPISRSDWNRMLPVEWAFLDKIKVITFSNIEKWEKKFQHSKKRMGVITPKGNKNG